MSNCTVGAPGTGAQLPATSSGLTGILPGGRAVTPAGKLFDIGGFPISLLKLNDQYVAVSDDAYGDQALRIVDTKAADSAHAVVSTVAFPLTARSKHTPGLLYGMALSVDGKRLFVSNGGYDGADDTLPPAMHFNTVTAYNLTLPPPSTLTVNATYKLMYNPATSSQRVPTGIAVTGTGQPGDPERLYAACQVDNTLAIIDTQSGAEIGTAKISGISPFDVAVDTTSHTAFVSLWGGAGKTDGVVPVDISNPSMPLAGMPITTGKAAEMELLLQGKLFVANTDADTVSIIDTAARTTKTLPATASMSLGASPSGVAIEPQGAQGNGRIYVANAGENAVVALDLSTMTILGRIPTAWYPTAVTVLGDGTVVIASTRGLGSGPNDGTPTPPFAAGTLQIVPHPSDADLKSGDATAQGDLDRAHALEPPLNCAANTAPKFPLPPMPGAESPIKHVFLIVRENKTYDALLGDMPGGNGSMAMNMYGMKVTPNAHALASTFVLLDNFYSHAELSVQGHQWTTACTSNDYTEKSWSHSDDYGRAYLLPIPWGPPSSLSHLALPGNGSVWANLDKAGLAYHNYGEIVNLGDAKTLADPAYPGVFFDTKVDDNFKVDYILQNLADPTFTPEPFSYIGLPNDHTNGTGVGQQTPASMIANNDEATGRFVEGLSHLPLWSSSIVFVVEDDPGDTFDHVDAHRSICLVASPWIKRGYRSSTNFDLASVYHTIGLILGTPPLNLNDAHAAGMYELFSPTADMTPFMHVPRQTPVAYNTASAPLAKESGQIDWSHPDGADLSRILWKAAFGANAEPPSRPRTHAAFDADDDDD